MQCYFYCTYQHSPTGFFLSRLDGETLAPVKGGGPLAVREFFSYDRFRFLWRDFGRSSGFALGRPHRTGGFCGVRKLEGTLRDGRGSTANLIFLAHKSELPLLRKVALTILGDMDAFRARFFSFLSVGGPCGYALDGKAFGQWVADCGKAGNPQPCRESAISESRLFARLIQEEPPRWERDFLRLACCTCKWSEVYHTMGNPLIWRVKPGRVLSEEEFSACFGRGAVWRMEGPDETDASAAPPDGMI